MDSGGAYSGKELNNNYLYVARFTKDHANPIMVTSSSSWLEKISKVLPIVIKVCGSEALERPTSKGDPRTRSGSLKHFYFHFLVILRIRRCRGGSVTKKKSFSVCW